MASQRVRKPLALVSKRPSHSQTPPPPCSPAPPTDFSRDGYTVGNPPYSGDYFVPGAEPLCGASLPPLCYVPFSSRPIITSRPPTSPCWAARQNVFPGSAPAQTVLYYYPCCIPHNLDCGLLRVSMATTPFPPPRTTLTFSCVLERLLAFAAVDSYHWPSALALVFCG